MAMAPSGRLFERRPRSLRLSVVPFRDVCQVSDMLACGNEHLKHLNASLRSVGDDGGEGGPVGVREVILSLSSSGVQGVFSLVRYANTVDTTSVFSAVVFFVGDDAA